MGMGKSVVDRILSQSGIAVVDTDQLARQLVEPGQPALLEIVEAFGKDILDAEGRLRRDELGRRVFHASADRERLESILHPRIRAAWKAQCELWASEGRSVAVIDIPLLHETGAESEFDAVICVACSEATQHSRLVPRGWSGEEIRNRLQAQWPISQKMAKSDYVLWNESTLEVLREQLARVFHAEKLSFPA